MQILITTLAEYQTRFWLRVGLDLKRRGCSPAFLSFDDRSSEMLRAAGLRVFSATGRPAGLDASEAVMSAAMSHYDIQKLNFWFGHERFAFGVSDSAELRRKLLWSLQAADEALEVLSAQGPVKVVQELGGFLSVIGTYFAARRRGIDNWFVEPSFFRGRLFFQRNSFAATDISGLLEDPVPAEVMRYLEETARQGAIVVPIKDQHQYVAGPKKIVNTRNIRRLVEKLIDKYVFGKRQEFGYIGSHVSAHIKMLLGSRRLRSVYTPLERCSPFVYYPLHVPGDMALTLRTPHLLDQLALIEFLCRSVPHTHLVAVKEHPAMVGAIDASRMLDLMQRYDNLRLLPPSTNNYEVLRCADVIVSINSKSGAEAALIGKPVVVLGDAFYRNSPLVRRVDNLRDLPQIVDEALGAAQNQCADLVPRYFAEVWRRCYAGELYVTDERNVDIFTNGMLDALSQDDDISRGA